MIFLSGRDVLFKLRLFVLEIGSEAELFLAELSEDPRRGSLRDVIDRGDRLRQNQFLRTDIRRKWWSI
jgi:hypothetical protein